MPRNVNTPPSFLLYAVLRAVIWVCVGFVVPLSGAATKVVTLDSGERLVGEILPKSNEQTVYLKSDILGEVTLPRSRVAVIEAKDSPKNVVAKSPSPSPAQPKPEVKPAPAPGPNVAAAELKERRVIKKLKDLKAPDPWKGSLKVGVNISSGDLKWTETYVNGKLEIQEKQSPSFYRFTGSYTYRETEREDGDSYKTTDKYDSTFVYRHSFAENWFAQNSLGGRVDQLKGIDRELQELLGLGLKIKPTEKLEFILGGGGGIEEFQSNQDEDTRNGLNPVMNIFQEFTWSPISRTTFVQKFNYYWNPEDNEQYNYVFKSAVRIRLTDLLGFEFSFSQNYDNDTGNRNAKDDTQWRNALIVYF